MTVRTRRASCRLVGSRSRRCRIAKSTTPKSTAPKSVATKATAPKAAAPKAVKAKKAATEADAPESVDAAAPKAKSLTRDKAAKPAKPRKNPAAKEFAIQAARLLADTRCHQVVVLDVSGLSPVTDYFVVGTGTSARQIRSVADDAEELGATTGNPKISRAGDESANWVVVDFFNVVVHVFTNDARAYYDVDGLWGDAKRVEWERPEEAKKPKPAAEDEDISE